MRHCHPEALRPGSLKDLNFAGCKAHELETVVAQMAGES
jgi:hypothetical protein